MKVSEIVELTGGEVLCGNDRIHEDLSQAFSSDLMSDVLTLGYSDILLITGLANNQVIRTAEMADIRHILIVRNKSVSADVLELARNSGVCLIKSPISMFKASGALFSAGLSPVY